MKIAAFLAAQAIARPDKVALVCGDMQVTFGQMHDDSSRIANALRDNGIVLGDRVAICLPNCCEFVTIFMAILKCGAVALPINMKLSDAEIAVIFADAKPAAVFFGRSEAAACVAPAPMLRICVGSDAMSGEIALADLLTHTAQPIMVPAEHDDCMISYTSGTTGQPKGVITTQANYIVANGFLNALHWGLSADDRILITTPLAHRTAFARVGNVIVLGATLHILPRFDAAMVADVIERERITLIGIVPTVGRMLLPVIESAPARFASLRVLVATGEAFPVDVKQRLLAALPDLGIFSFFAMTESGALAMLRPHEQFDHGTSVGRVTPGAELRLVDDLGHDVAPGEAGEIWARSGLPGQYLIFRGYYQRDEATRDAFADGWFKTGDIGRFDADGFLYIVDRKKDMVVSGGYNIYSKEVELALCRHPAVADAAVIGVPDEKFGEAVAAFIEMEPGATITEADLIGWCADALAGYKKPKYIRFIAELPRNTTGKTLKTSFAWPFRRRHWHDR